MPVFFKYIFQYRLLKKCLFPISCSANFNAEEPTSRFVMQCDFMFDCTLSCHNVIKMNLNRQKFPTNLFMSVCVCVF